jgi:hypothetical protein
LIDGCGGKRSHEEQHQSAEHHAQEEVESAFVCLAHAFAYPGTVMVVSFDAAIAILAMA